MNQVRLYDRIAKGLLIFFILGFILAVHSFVNGLSYTVIHLSNAWIMFFCHLGFRDIKKTQIMLNEIYDEE